MLGQAQILHERFKSNKYWDMENDWKIITLFGGGNDLCVFCNPGEENKHTPDSYTKYIADALHYLHQHFPRTFVNLVLVLDVRGVKLLNEGGPVCTLLHKKTCPCAAFPTIDQEKTLANWTTAYQELLVNLVNSGIYDTREDFTVVVQPFMAKTPIPYKDHEIDYSYFAPDCFHFSGKGHATAALSLWNNMLEEVGEKKMGMA